MGWGLWRGGGGIGAPVGVVVVLFFSFFDYG